METFELCYQGARAKFRSTGGELTSFVPAGGKEMIWHGDPKVWASHSPLLFPIVGSAVEDTIRIAGKPYPMKKHGFTRAMEFQKARIGEDFIELTIEETPETLTNYPFQFTLHIVHAIDVKGFSTTFVVDNRSDRDMPMCIGGHPGFVCPMREGERFEDYELEFPYAEDGENSLAPGGGIITGKERLPALAGGMRLPLTHAYFDEKDALILTNLASRSVKLVHKDTGKGVFFSFPKFDALGVWSAPGKNAPYVCLEPWSGIPALQGESGNMEDKPYVRILKPGESYRTGYSAMVI